MADSFDTQALQAWDCDLLVPSEEYQRMQAHPRAQAAGRALAQSSLTAPLEDKTLLGIFKDAGRYVSAMWAIHLHVTGGLSLPRLKDLCVQSTFVSPGRARALLFYMRYLGYVEPARTREAKAPALYVPTARFFAAWTVHMRTVLEAVRVIEPSVQTVIDHLHEPEIFNCVVRCQGESLLNATRVHSADQGYFRVFINRHGGTQMLSLMLTSDPDQPFPPERIAGLSLAAMARQFDVSRVQLRRMLAHGEKEGLLYQENDSIILTERLQTQVRLNFAIQLRHLLLSASRASRRLPGVARRHTALAS